MSGTYKEYFSLFKEIFDPKNTGTFSLQTVEAVLIANGFLDEKASVLSLLKYLDADDSGKIATEEVEALLHPDFIKLEDPANIQDMFEYFDRGEDNYIDVDELIHTSEELGFPLTKHQAEIMINNFDSDKDGKVTLEDFNEIFADR